MTIGELAICAHVDVNDAGIIGEDFVSLLGCNFFYRHINLAGVGVLE
jgi:hypothetical protein